VFALSFRLSAQARLMSDKITFWKITGSRSPVGAAAVMP
jgi:hypothetical protein